MITLRARVYAFFTLVDDLLNLRVRPDEYRGCQSLEPKTTYFNVNVFESTKRFHPYLLHVKPLISKVLTQFRPSMALRTDLSCITTELWEIVYCSFHRRVAH